MNDPENKPPSPLLGSRKPARLRVREKGSGKKGHVYQGQEIVIPCKGCGTP